CAFPYGQAVSRSTYSTLFSLFSTTYGTGDGSTTFNLHDLRGRIPAGKDDMGGTPQGRLTTAGGGIDGATLGAIGGSQNVTLAANQIPTITSVNALQSISVTTNQSTRATNDSTTFQGGGTVAAYFANSGASLLSTASGNNSISVTYTNSS